MSKAKGHCKIIKDGSIPPASTPPSSLQSRRPRRGSSGSGQQEIEAVGGGGWDSESDTSDHGDPDLETDASSVYLHRAWRHQEAVSPCDQDPMARGPVLSIFTVESWGGRP